MSRNIRIWKFSKKKKKTCTSIKIHECPDNVEKYVFRGEIDYSIHFERPCRDIKKEIVTTNIRTE